MRLLDEDGWPYILCSVCEGDGNLYHQREDQDPDFHLCPTCYSVDKEFNRHTLRERFEKALNNCQYDVAERISNLYRIYLRPPRNGR